jgi:hypothetical protein
MFHHVVWYKFTDISEMLATSIISDDDGGASEMSVNFYQTIRRNVPEDSHLHEGDMFL